MSFQLPKGIRTYYERARPARDSAYKFIMFDQYYACLLAGLDARVLGSNDELESDVFINAYPDDYKAQIDLIAGLLIDAELDRKGIQQNDRASVEREMVSLLNPTSPTHLSANGNILLNLYAAAGFALIQQEIGPSPIEDFLVAYFRYWHKDQSGVGSSEEQKAGE